MPRRFISSGPRTWISSFASAAVSRAISAMRCGVSTPAGSFTRSRAKLVAEAVTSPSAIPSDASRTAASPTATRISRRWRRPERGSER